MINMGAFIDIDALTDEILPLAKQGLEDGSFVNVCLGFLDGSIRIQVFPPGGNEGRDRFLWAMQILGASVAMDSIAHVSDSYATTSPTKSDGSQWQRGEITAAFNDPSSPDHHLVSEALTINIFDRTGGGAMASIHYARKADGTIELGERESGTEGDGASMVAGAVSEGLRAAMLQEPIDRMLKEKGVDPALFGYDAEETAMRIACVAVKTVAGQGVPVALAPRNEREMEIMRDSFENGPQFGSGYQFEEF